MFLIQILGALGSLVHWSTQKACSWRDPEGFGSVSPFPLLGCTRAGRRLCVCPSVHSPAWEHRRQDRQTQLLRSYPRAVTCPGSPSTGFRDGLTEHPQGPLISLSGSRLETKVWGAEPRPWVLTPSSAPTRTDCLLQDLQLASKAPVGDQPPGPHPQVTPSWCQLGPGPPSADNCGEGGSSGDQDPVLVQHESAASGQVLPPPVGPFGLDDLRGMWLPRAPALTHSPDVPPSPAVFSGLGASGRDTASDITGVTSSSWCQPPLLRRLTLERGAWRWDDGSRRGAHEADRWRTSPGQVGRSIWRELLGSDLEPLRTFEVPGSSSTGSG